MNESSTRKFKNLSVLLTSFVLLLTLVTPEWAGPLPPGTPPQRSRPTDQMLLDRISRETKGQMRISHHAETGKVRFVGAQPGTFIPRSAGVMASTKPDDAALNFLREYGQLFGLQNPTEELTVMRSRVVDGGRSFVRWQQVYQGIPVLAGELIVQMDAHKNVISAGGEILPAIALNTTPQVDAKKARQAALEMVAQQYQVKTDDLLASEPELWVYNPALLGGPGARLDTLVWRTEVTPLELLPIRELVLVDAQFGLVALHFNQIATAKNRIVYDNNNDRAAGLPGTGPVRIEGQAATGNAEVDNAYDYAGDTFDFYNAYHLRDSIDNAGMTIISTVRFCYSDKEDCPLPNAFWNGSQMVYGDGFASADDIVGHELTHGVTSHESKLFYYMQSGAINETFSDIWGEFVDQTNGAGSDTADDRWKIGEDVPGGAARNMQDPTIEYPPNPPLPDKMSSPNYWCNVLDNGGVHINCGVGLKTAYLMVDGDDFNGQTITGIGLAKTARIWYEVQTNMLTSGSDYGDLHDALYQACHNLLISGVGGITANDCTQVEKAITATEMSQQPTSCAAPHAPLCPTEQTPQNIFFDDLETISSGNWITGTQPWSGNDWYYPQTANPHGFDATYATSGSYNLWGYNREQVADYYIGMASDVTLPPNSFLHFNHAFEFDIYSDEYNTLFVDGGVVMYSPDGTNWWDVGSLFTHNGYNGTIYSGVGASNPLAGYNAFIGLSGGYLSSRLDLNPLAGQSVRFYFRIATDQGNSMLARGWFIDDVRIYTCAGAAPALSISKSGPSTAYSGDPITYTLSVANSGSVEATNLVISDTIPAGASYISGGTKDGNVVRWTLPALADGGQVGFQYVVTASQTITNDDYRVSADGGISAKGGVAVVTTVSEKPQEPVLSIGKTGPAQANAGDPITYTLTVVNSGIAAATSLIISDTVPANAHYVSGGTKVGNVVRWTLPSLAANGGETRATFVVTASQTITNDNYRTSANGGFSATGSTAVVTTIEQDGSEKKIFLPLLLRRH